MNKFKVIISQNLSMITINHNLVKEPKALNRELARLNTGILRVDTYCFFSKKSVTASFNETKSLVKQALIKLN